MSKDILAVHSVHSFELAMPDLSEAERFYRAFGLAVKRQAAELGEKDRLHVGAASSQHSVLHIREGARKKLLSLSFGIYEADLPRFAGHLVRSGIELLAADNTALRFNDPDGNTIELIVAPKTSPDNALPVSTRLQAPKRSQVAPVQPLGLSHLLLFSPDVPRAIAFYEKTFGLRLSDRAGDDIAFLHTPHGSDHHLIAFVRSEGPGLHHSSWRVGSLDEVGRGAMQMAAHGFEQGWGVGRHVLGSNYFHYVRDPSGGYAEFSFDMDYIAAGSHWAAGSHDGEDAFYIWGPPPPPEFTVNTELT